MAKSTKPQYVDHYISSTGSVISLVFASKLYQIKQNDRKVLFISYDEQSAKKQFQKMKSNKQPDLSPGEVDQLADKRTSIKSD